MCSRAILYYGQAFTATTATGGKEPKARGGRVRQCARGGRAPSDRFVNLYKTLNSLAPGSRGR